jgi:hypothetical protein
VEGEDDIHCLNVTVGTDFFEKKILFGCVADKLDCPECLTG